MAMSVTTYSTQEVAKLLGIHKSTLLRWLYSARIAEPKHATIAMQNHRVWSERDLKRVEKFKEASYRKKPRRKKAGSARVKRSNRRLS